MTELSSEQRSEQRLLFVREAMNRACKEALPLIESDGLNYQGIQLTKGFLNGELTLGQYHEKSKKLHDPGNVGFPDVESLRLSLYLWGKTPNVIDKNAKHEELHFETARRAGFKVEYGIRIVKIRGRERIRCCNVHIDLPESGDEDEIRKKLRAVVEATGEDMSVSDIESLPTTEPTLV